MIRRKDVRAVGKAEGGDGRVGEEEGVVEAEGEGGAVEDAVGAALVLGAGVGDGVKVGEGGHQVQLVAPLVVHGVAQAGRGRGGHQGGVVVAAGVQAGRQQGAVGAQKVHRVLEVKVCVEIPRDDDCVAVRRVRGGGGGGGGQEGGQGGHLRALVPVEDGEMDGEDVQQHRRRGGGEAQPQVDHLSDGAHSAVLRKRAQLQFRPSQPLRFFGHVQYAVAFFAAFLLFMRPNIKRFVDEAVLRV